MSFPANGRHQRFFEEGPSGPKSLAACGSRSPPLRGCFNEFAYTWSIEGAPREGVLLLGYDEQVALATAAWIDSWHQSARVMHLSGTRVNERTISVQRQLRRTAGAGPGLAHRCRCTQIENPDLLDQDVQHLAETG